MTKSVLFDSQVRNNLKDFIGAKGWSVSRFAARYVDKYAEMYSKPEAPSTSTARKLIEDKTHVFTEKEIAVLESMTSLPLMQHWLENQHKALLAKSSGYADTSDSMDPEALLQWEIRRRSEKQRNQDRESLEAVLQRYAAVETSKPLLILTDPDLAENIPTLICDILKDGEELDKELLKAYGEDLPRDIIVCYDRDNEYGVDYVEGVELVRHAIKMMISARAINRLQHIILVFNTDETSYETILREWQTAAYIFIYNPKEEVIKPFKYERPKKETADYREFCLTRMRTLPQMFKDEVMQCDKLAACTNPTFCAYDIQTLYQSQREWFDPDNYFYAPFRRLLAMGLPENWFDDDYDREGVLTGLAEYYAWRKNKEKELKKAGVSVKDDKWHRNGIKSVIDHLNWILGGMGIQDIVEEWHQRYEFAYIYGLMQD